MTNLVLKTNFAVTPKVLNHFLEFAKSLKKTKICICECHRCNILNWHKQNAISVISQFQCIECPCPPIQYDAHEFDILNSKFRRAYEKSINYPKNTIGCPYPTWLIRESLFMHVLIQNLLKEG